MTTISFGTEVRDGYDSKASVILAAYPHGTDAEAATSSKNLFRDTAFAWPTWRGRICSLVSAKTRHTSTTSITVSWRRADAHKRN